MFSNPSLNNASNSCRWTLDLRWQRTDRPVGFYGLASGTEMRRENDPNFKIDWSSFEKTSLVDAIKAVATNQVRTNPQSYVYGL